MSGARQLLFLGGCPRSGTTALAGLLNAHPDCMIGVERYHERWRRGEVVPADFARERFLRIEPEDLHERHRGQFHGWDAGAAYDRARIIGDKFPPIWTVYALIAERFAGSRLLYIMRNPVSVAESYEARAEDPEDEFPFFAVEAVEQWNESLRSTLAELAAGRDIVVVSYEALFASAAAADALYAALGLDPSLADGGRIRSILAETGRRDAAPPPRREALRRMVLRSADLAAWHRMTDEHCILSRRAGAAEPRYTAATA